MRANENLLRMVQVQQYLENQEQKVVMSITLAH
jgi:hypothetical protein